MRLVECPERREAFTLIELFMIAAVLAILTEMILKGTFTNRLAMP